MVISHISTSISVKKSKVSFLSRKIDSVDRLTRTKGTTTITRFYISWVAGITVILRYWSKRRLLGFTAYVLSTCFSINSTSALCTANVLNGKGRLEHVKIWGSTPQTLIVSIKIFFLWVSKPLPVSDHPSQIQFFCMETRSRRSDIDKFLEILKAKSKTLPHN